MRATKSYSAQLVMIVIASAAICLVGCRRHDITTTATVPTIQSATVAPDGRTLKVKFAMTTPAKHGMPDDAPRSYRGRYHLSQ